MSLVLSALRTTIGNFIVELHIEKSGVVVQQFFLSEVKKKIQLKNFIQLTFLDFTISSLSPRLPQLEAESDRRLRFSVKHSGDNVAR